jgi:microcystin-dependent protein
MMFGGSSSDIPKGWSICDGTNGTPNLIGKFIKASTTSGETGGKNEITLTIDNIPSHSHALSGSVNTSTDGAHSHTYTAPK